MNDLLIKNGLVFLNGKWVKTNLAILGEKISYIGNDEVDAKEILDVKGLKVLPGLIDPHVHFELNCGRTTSCDDFYTGSVCAAYGGVTTIIDFLDPTRNAEELEKSYYERIALAKKSLVDYHMHACIREPNGDLEEYVKKVVELGMRTIKLFTTYSDTHRRTYDKDIAELLRLSKKYNVMIEAHIENDDLIDLRDEYTYKDLPVSRPSLSETSEALKLAKLVRETGGNFYMVHCSSGETLKALKEQFSDILGKNFFVESCPQYFVFNNSVLEREDGKLFTFAPPLRSERERQLLTAYYKDINAIGTDHCAFMKKEKDYPSLKGFPLGVGGVEHSFSIMYRRFGDEIIDKMSKNTGILQDFPTKGELEVGKDADISIFQELPDFFEKENHGTCDYSIYDGVIGAGEFRYVLVRGQFVLKDRKIIPHTGKEIICGE
jgi:dihydropyrimidinase